jgi:predicted SAM-dependent methyltransferase
MSRETEIRVVIGAGEYSNNPTWMQTQEKDLNLLNEGDWAALFSDNSIQAILAEHVWEHLTYKEGVQAAKNCYTYLKSGGYVRCAVPDPDDHPAASHKIVHTYQTVTKMFEEAGFEVRLLEYCNDAGEFVFNEWDEKDGYIYRSKRFDHRNLNGELGFVSLIVDAIKS